MEPHKLTEEEMWDIEDSLTIPGKGGSGGRGGHKGEKASESMKRSFRENAEEKRKEEAKGSLKRELQYFPFKGFSEEKVFEAIDAYSDWVLESLPTKFPVFSNLDDEIEYKQSRSSGPGGQNVNKTSTAVTARHKMTGMFSRSEDTREAVVNKRSASSKLFSKLEDHIKSWGTYLKNIPKEERKDEIVSFMKDFQSEKRS